MSDLAQVENRAFYWAAFFGALLCLLGVALGAFGAHALAGVLDQNDTKPIFELANRYQFYHGLALLALAYGLREEPGVLIWYSRLVVAGTLIFSGSLYVLALSNIKIMGAITPIGGTLLLIAWALVVVHFLRRIRQ